MQLAPFITIPIVIYKTPRITANFILKELTNYNEFLEIAQIGSRPIIYIQSGSFGFKVND